MIRRQFVALVATCALGVSSPTPENAVAVTVNIKDMQFAPSSLTVHVGDVVQFKNSDDVVHNVTGGPLHSGDIEGGKTWSFRFTTAGTYSFVCTYHPWMKGSITAAQR